MTKHAAQLSTPPSSDPDLEAARVFARTFFSGFRIPSIFREIPLLEGSTRASVESSRLFGGARSYLRALIAEETGTSASDDTNFVGMREHAPGQVIEDRGLPSLTSD